MIPPDSISLGAPLAGLWLAAALLGSVAWAQSVPTTPPFAHIPSEAQRRALTGFPRVDSEVLDARFGVVNAYYDRSRHEYVWLLKGDRGDDLQGASLVARFMDGGGRALTSVPLALRRLETPHDGAVAVARIAAPAQTVLDRTEIVRVVETQEEQGP